MGDVGEWLNVKDSIRRDSNGNYYFRVYELVHNTTLASEGDGWGPGPVVNINTFKICKGTKYAKDWKRVYYGIECVGLELRKGRFRDNPEGLRFITDGLIIDGCSPYTFKYIGDGYAIDHKHMYRYGKRIPWDDGVIDRQLKRTSEDHYRDTVPIHKYLQSLNSDLWYD